MREKFPPLEEEKQRLGVQHVFGDPEEAVKEMKRIISPQEKAKGELLPTPDEEAIIKQAIQEIKDFIEANTGIIVSLFPDHIHIVEPGTYGLSEKGTLGDQSSFTGEIFVARQPLPIFTSVLIHELVHATGPRSLQMTKEKKLAPYRSGITSYNRRGDQFYFRNIEEAVVASITRMIFDSMVEEVDVLKEYKREISEWRELLKKRMIDVGFDVRHARYYSRLLIYVRDTEALTDVLRSGDVHSKETFDVVMLRLVTDGKVIFRERLREVESLVDVIERIALLSTGEFTDKSKVFYMFVRAHVTGRYLPLARLIEAGLGEGSFRKMAEEFMQTSARITKEHAGETKTDQ
jgi:hypothetical protein